MTSHNLSISERIEKHIISKNGCWITNYGCDGSDYPQITINGKTRKLLRVMFELKNGEIPPQMCVLHKCDNPACINPDHLFLGSHLENMKDRNNKNRQAKGSQHGNSKLNKEKVLEIKRDLAETTFSQREIAKRYGVSKATITNIKTGRTWSHVNYQPTNITNNTTNNYNAPVTITNYNCSECQRQLSLFDVDEIK